MIRAVIFDMDGLMFDTERLTSEATEKAGEKFGCRDIMELFPHVMGVNAKTCRNMYLAKYGPEFPYEEFQACRQSLIDGRIRKDGVPVKAGLSELLAYLRREKYAAAVATSTSRLHALEYIRSAGVEPFFDRIVCGDMIERSKPAPDIYLRAAEELKTGPRFCMALEDSPNGLRSARAAGMAAVMVPDLIPPSAELRSLAAAVVPSLSDVIALLKQWNAAGRESPV